MAAHTHRPHSSGLDRVFIGVCTTVFVGLSLAAAWSVWAAFR